VDRADGVILGSRSNQVSLLFLRKHECKSVLRTLCVTLIRTDFFVVVVLIHTYRLVSLTISIF
jgi:hypothetical protein